MDKKNKFCFDVNKFLRKKITKKNYIKLNLRVEGHEKILISHIF